MSGLQFKCDKKKARASSTFISPDQYGTLREDMIFSHIAI